MQAQPPIELHGTLILSDITRYQYFHTLRRTWPVAVFAALVLILFVPFLVTMDITNSGNPGWRDVLTNALPFFVLLLVWLLLVGVFPYVGARRHMAAQIYLREPITYTFDSEKISGDGASAHWSIARSVLKRIRETKSLFLLYHASNIAVIVPKRFFQSPSEMEHWRQVVSTYISPKRIEKPGLVGRLC